MCVERWVQRFFSPFSPSWTAPVPPAALDALDAAVLRRMRYLAACPLLVAVWSIAALAIGGASAQRMGTLGAGVMQTVVLCATSFRAVGRTLAGAQHLTNFFTLFLVLVLSSLPLMTWTTGNECDMLHTKMYASSPKGSKDARCAILMWDLFFASLLVGGTVTSLQVARRLETALLVQLLTGARSRSRDAFDDAAEKGHSSRHTIVQAPSACGDDANSNDAPMPRPSTRRAAGLLAAPRAEVIRSGGRNASNGVSSSSSVSPQRRRYSFYTASTNALYEGDDGGGDADADHVEAGVVLRGVLINTGPPQNAPRRSSTACASGCAVVAPAAPPLAQEARPQLPRKLTQ